MNAEYKPAVAYRLIESAHDPHESCHATLEFSNSAASFFMRRADRYQRRSRILAAVSFALAGIVVALVVTR